MSYKIGTVTLAAKDVQAVKAFYVEKLGFSVIEEISDEFFIALRTKGETILSLRPADENVAEAGKVDIGFQVDDVKAVYEEWVDRGVHIHEEIKDFPFGCEFSAKDPEGQVLVVFQLHNTQ